MIAPMLKSPSENVALSVSETVEINTQLVLKCRVLQVLGEIPVQRVIQVFKVHEEEMESQANPDSQALPVNPAPQAQLA